jgi:ABC-type multidrug transport system ATPase subunit
MLILISATLTVRETLKFSIDCQTALSEDQKNAKIDEILRMLDLSHVQNTLVGNDLVRGISGGQKKRVTIGVSLTTGPSIVLLDEPTTGLDANTSLEVRL